MSRPLQKDPIQYEQKKLKAHKLLKGQQKDMFKKKSIKK